MHPLAEVRPFVLAIGLVAGLAPALAGAQSTSSYLRQLSDSDQAEAAVAALARQGEAVIPKLLQVIRGDSDMAARGWAVIALGRVQGSRSYDELRKLHEDRSQPELIRTWAAAARILRTSEPKALFELASLQRELPALERPLKKQFAAVIGGANMGAEEMLKLSMQMPQLQQMVVEPLLGGGPGPLVGVMTRSRDDNLRRQAAAYLATLAQRKGAASVAGATVSAYQFRPGAGDVPWSGGALFVPGISWPKEDATALVDSLIAWHVWANERGRNDLQQQIHNNIRSLSLARVVGYQSPGWGNASTEQWLDIWVRTAGANRVRSILRQQGLHKVRKYERFFGSRR